MRSLPCQSLLYKSFASLFALACLQLAAQSPTALPTPPPAAPAPTEIKLEHFSPSQVDSSLDPCVDFHQYACSKFFKANPIPSDQAVWGAVSPLALWNETVLRQTLEEAAAKKQNLSPIEQKLGDYWTACMDEASIQKSAPGELQSELDRVEAIQNSTQLIEEIARVHGLFPGSWDAGDNQTDTAVFGFTSSQDFDNATRIIAAFDQAGLHLPVRDFYLADNPRFKQILEKYAVHVANMLKLSGESREKASADAKVVLAMETEMARAMMDNVKRRDPKNVNNKMSLEELQALAPSLNLKHYLEVVHAPASPVYLISSPDFFRALEQMMHVHPLEDWKTYMRWSIVTAAAPTLSEPFEKENWSFYGATLSGTPQMQPRWRRCVRAANRDLGEMVGQAYVQKAFPPASKRQANAIVDALGAALDQDIQQIQWMTPETKQKAAEKLHLILDKIGYPDKWRDYSALKTTHTSALANVAAASDFERNRWVQKIGKAVDRNEWGMVPATINAYYDAQTNTINFPAGILQPPLFDPAQDQAANYGAMGAIIGHEITHGFDDQGRKFDGHGDMRDWWTPADAKAYEERSKCISDEYTAEVPELGVKTNGLLTLGEDTADNGGIHLALLALENTLRAEGKLVNTPQPNGLTPLQEFFLSYANGWCMQIRPEVARNSIASNPHSLPKFRTNNVLANIPEFAAAFGCKSGQPMVHANACRVW